MFYLLFAIIASLATLYFGCVVPNRSRVALKIEQKAQAEVEKYRQVSYFGAFSQDYFVLGGSQESGGSSFSQSKRADERRRVYQRCLEENL
jgi:hypothetical protein